MAEICPKAVRRLPWGLVALLAATPAAASDWPQFGGAGRDFQVEGQELATSWPEDGPRVLWRRELGEGGYSGVAVVGDRLFTMYRRDDGHEVVLAGSTATGETLWEHSYPAPFADYMRMEHGTGPHVTPLVVGDRVFTVGIRGGLTALDRGSGEVLWVRELVEEMGGAEMGRGYSTSPIAFEGSVIVYVGGEGQAVVSFDQEEGKVLWKGGSFATAPSSPTLIDVDGEPQLVVFGGGEIIGLDPRRGRQLWSHPHPTSYGLNISVPIWGEDDRLFLSSAYNGGSRVLELERRDGETQVKELWAHKQMRIHMSNGIRIGDYIYASSGDFGAVPMAAVNVGSGEMAWRDRAFARANIVHADGKLIVLDEDGVLGLATASPEGLTVHAKVELLDARCWTAPTLVGRVLYARDLHSLVALELPRG